VRDTSTGKMVNLTEGVVGVTESLRATIRTADAETHEVRAGDQFQVGDVSYFVEDIVASPPAVTITKRSPRLASPDRRVLKVPALAEVAGDASE
jgi:hypothetical protein